MQVRNEGWVRSTCDRKWWIWCIYDMAHLYYKFSLKYHRALSTLEYDIAKMNRKSVKLEFKNCGYKGIYFVFLMFTNIGESDRCVVAYIYSYNYLGHFHVRSPTLPCILQWFPISPAVKCPGFATTRSQVRKLAQNTCDNFVLIYFDIFVAFLIQLISATHKQTLEWILIQFSG